MRFDYVPRVGLIFQCVSSMFMYEFQFISVRFE